MGIAKDNISRKDQETFVKLVTKGLLEIGAVIQPKDERLFPSTEFKLNTIVGVLDITLYHSHKFLFKVFSRFEDVDRAKEKFSCNPYSGKFNFYVSKNKDFPMEQVVKCVLIHFKCTMPNE